MTSNAELQAAAVADGDEQVQVLLVEDDEGDALLVRECLREAGLPEDDLIWCRTVAEGVDALAELVPNETLAPGAPDSSRRP